MSETACNTYDNAGNAVLGVTAFLQVLRDNGEDGWRQGHVEETMRLLATLLELLKVLLEVLKGLILVILSGNVGADLGELVKLLLNLLGGGLDV